MNKWFLIPAILVNLLFASSAFAQQGQIEKVLKAAYPGEPNTKFIELSEIKSEKVKETIQSVEFGFEMGDGYFDVMTSATYMVFTSNGELAGFMHAALVGYTEDPEFYLVAALVTTNGVRVGAVHNLNTFTDKSEFLQLPKELRPSDI